MPDTTAVSRTLVKSPPELWAELSDPTALARHLEPFGDITITRTEPEHTVAWEGESASGTVALEPAGWGTRVTLTVVPEAPQPRPQPPRRLRDRLAFWRRPKPEPEADGEDPDAFEPVLSRTL